MNVQKVNYQKELDKILDRIQKENKVPSLLLHSCCAPCSSYVLEYLSEYFEITVFYYNPNIYPESEYEKRIKEQWECLIWCLILKRRTDISGLRNSRQSTVCTVRITAAVSSLWRSGRGKNRKRNGKIRCFLHLFDIYGRHFTL